MFRAIYLSEKRALWDEEREDFIQENKYYNNKCIGGGQGCGRNSKKNQRYAEKVKRYPNADEAKIDLDEGKLEELQEEFDNLSLEVCGRCPIANELEALLNGAARGDKLLSSGTVPDAPLILDEEILVHFDNPDEDEYDWVLDDQGDLLFIFIQSGEEIQCEIHLQKSDAEVTWNDVEWFVGLEYLHRPLLLDVEGERRTFKVRGYLQSGSYIEIEGYISCVDLVKCISPLIAGNCEVYEIGEELFDIATFLLEYSRFSRTDLGMDELIGSNILAFHDQRTVNELQACQFPGEPGYTWNFDEWFDPTQSDDECTGTDCASPPSSDENEYKGIRGTLLFNRDCNNDAILEDRCEVEFELLESGFLDFRLFDPARDDFFGGPLTFELEKIESEENSCTGKSLIIRVTNEIGLSVLVRMTSECFVPGDCCVENPCPHCNLPSCCTTEISLPPFESACEAEKEDEIQDALAIQFNLYKDSLRQDIRQSYINKCMDTKELFEASFEEQIHHYTLYYYDLSGNLARTIPPKGVQLLSDVELARAKAFRNGDSSVPVYPSHKMATTYSYNSLNEITERDTPDGGTSTYWYDRLGRPIVSQDAVQKARQDEDGEYVYGYIRYDEFNRIVETGEIVGGEAVTLALVYSPEALQNWYLEGARTDFTHMKYDKPLNEATNNLFEGGQQFLRKRVATKFREKVLTGNRHLTHYSYDAHGNVRELVQENPQMPVEHQSKRVLYDYDLVSSNLKEISYQPNSWDQFIYRYLYDLDNRLKTVLTSKDGLLFNKDAGYKYYNHGLLARLALGEEKVQGIDYAYTIHGWLKVINSTSLRPDKDIGHDGYVFDINQNTIANDSYGLSLNYYLGDYLAIKNKDQALASGTGTILERDNLFSGNIKNQIDSFYIPNKSENVYASVYRYDQLGRIRSMDSYRGFNKYLNSWRDITQVSDYRSRYSYDLNGNLLTVRRNGLGEIVMDNLKYYYSKDQNNNKVIHIADESGQVYSEDYGVTDPYNDLQKEKNNFDYDPKGQLVRDNSLEVSKINWNFQGQISEVKGKGRNIKIEYNAENRRVIENDGTEKKIYIRDFDGNVLALYALKGDTMSWVSSMIYGDAQLGIYNSNLTFLSKKINKNNRLNVTRGNRIYFITNHLGSVMAEVRDRRIASSHFFNNTTALALYEPSIERYFDYFPFGMKKPQSDESKYEGRDYGFQGMKIDKVFSNRNIYSTSFRGYDSRIGRWISMDPVESHNPYLGLNNNPIVETDPLGLQPRPRRRGRRRPGSNGRLPGEIQPLHVEPLERHMARQEWHRYLRSTQPVQRAPLSPFIFRGNPQQRSNEQFRQQLRFEFMRNYERVQAVANNYRLETPSNARSLIRRILNNGREWFNRYQRMISRLNLSESSRHSVKVTGLNRVTWNDPLARLSIRISEMGPNSSRHVTVAAATGIRNGRVVLLVSQSGRHNFTSEQIRVIEDAGRALEAEVVIVESTGGHAEQHITGHSRSNGDIYLRDMGASNLICANCAAEGRGQGVLNFHTPEKPNEN